MQNTMSVGGVVGRIAQRSVAAREAAYAAEVRALLDAALQTMRERGTASRPRVADIVAAAGLSNDAFYRHFRSKDDLVAALLADGSERLVRYVAHQMAKEDDPVRQVRRWVAAVLSQAKGETAATTLAVLWNGSAIAAPEPADDGQPVAAGAAGRHYAAKPLANLLVAPFTALGAREPARDAGYAAHAALGTLSDLLWHRRSPTTADVDALTAFLVRGAAERTGTDSTP
jgi:AcrR family transcriptional regulator